MSSTPSSSRALDAAGYTSHGNDEEENDLQRQSEEDLKNALRARIIPALAGYLEIVFDSFEFKSQWTDNPLPVPAELLALLLVESPGGGYTCPFGCPKTSSQSTHAIYHIAEEIQWAFRWRCEFCSAEFHRYDGLRQHRLVHRTPWFTQCPNGCPAVFKYGRPKNINKHLRERCPLARSG